MKNITEYVMKLWHVMKHSFAPNPDLEICPPLRRSQNCRWGRQTQPGKSVAINKEQRAYSDPSLFMVNFMYFIFICHETKVRLDIIAPRLGAYFDLTQQPTFEWFLLPHSSVGRVPVPDSDKECWAWRRTGWKCGPVDI